MSELKPGGSNAKATEPGSVQARNIIYLKNEDKEERPAGIQQSKNAEIRMTRARYSEELRSNKKCCGDYQHIEERGHQPSEKHDKEAALVSNSGGRPVRKRHQASDILLQSSTLVQTKPVTDTWLQTQEI